MSLELNKLMAEVEALSQSAAQRAAELAIQVPQAAAALAELEQADDRLRAKIDKAGDRWPGAVPTDEPIGVCLPLPPLPSQFVVLGADGSQIYPDRHGAALYYLINIGSLAYFHGSGTAPAVNTVPHVYYEENMLYSAEGEGQIPNAIIDGRRDAAELGELARLAKEYAGRSVVAMLDNGLLLWLALQLQDKYQRQVKAVLDEYLAHLDALQAAGAAVAGFVGRPRTANVLALLHLNSLPVEQINEDTVRANRYRGLTDRAVFERRLAPGERSALFINNSPVNRRDFEHHLIHFFYLNAGRPGRPEIARVEVPRWVAANPALLNLTHAAIVEQCRLPDGFPYVLVRAHELAVVTTEEKSAFDQMVQTALWRHGLPASISQKAQTKLWTAAKRRHKL